MEDAGEYLSICFTIAAMRIQPLATDMCKTGRDQEEIQNKLINEEYKIWKKNSVFLYDIMYRYAARRQQS